MMLAAQSQLEQEMQEQQAQGGLLHGEQMAEFSRLEAQANAKTSRTKTALDTLATTQQASSCCAMPQLHATATVQVFAALPMQEARCLLLQACSTSTNA